MDNNKFIVPGLILALALAALGAVLYMSGKEAREGVEPPLEDAPPEDRGLIETRIDQGASTLGIKIVPVEVLEDSRCPSDVQCIQAGTVRVRALVSNGETEGENFASYTFVPGESLQIGDRVVSLLAVYPEPHAGEQIEENNYRFIFEIKRTTR
ncbi:MAG: hypothetical protein UY63_C0004G0044 [Parcubacteria group bacterium GW2011_GWA2_51_10]|nr:MAG: hypothetical protein UY63_C0004G0044 [Parcubacteria group bacterium GW2011_GWA2_51_10]